MALIYALMHWIIQSSPLKPPSCCVLFDIYVASSTANHCNYIKDYWGLFWKLFAHHIFLFSIKQASHPEKWKRAAAEIFQNRLFKEPDGCYLLPQLSRLSTFYVIVFSFFYLFLKDAHITFGFRHCCKNKMNRKYSKRRRSL